MATFLFDKTIFGPVKSRRLGVSLGVNLMPNDSKVCSFDCIYCECGWNPKKRTVKAVLPSRDEVRMLMEQKLNQMAVEGELPDVITFAGNGEPTLHPEFEGIIGDTIELRDRLSPKARIAVLSNSSMLHKDSVVRALFRVDDNILKLDSGIEETVRRIDCPAPGFKLAEVVENLKKFEGKLIIQTMFLQGTFKNEIIDNTSEEELLAWIRLLQEIQPEQVMIYTIDRDTPASGLRKVSLAELETIAGRIRELGFKVQVSG